MFVALFSMYISGLYLFVNATFVTFFVGICKNCKAFFYQFEYLVQKLNPATPQKSLRELIQYHESAKK